MTSSDHLWPRLTRKGRFFLRFGPRKAYAFPGEYFRTQTHWFQRKIYHITWRFWWENIISIPRNGQFVQEAKASANNWQWIKCHTASSNKMYMWQYTLNHKSPQTYKHTVTIGSQLKDTFLRLDCNMEPVDRSYLYFFRDLGRPKKSNFVMKYNGKL